jgi:hypothetical protein
MKTQHEKKADKPAESKPADPPAPAVDLDAKRKDVEGKIEAMRKGFPLMGAQQDDWDALQAELRAVVGEINRRASTDEKLEKK